MKEHKPLFDYEPLIVRSPGRINLIGEHTDYNEGFVMPAAIDKGITFRIAPARSATSVIYSENFNERYVVPAGALTPAPNHPWANYLLGVLHRLSAYADVPHFRCSLAGDLPIGSGMSSSAALECGFAFALNECFRLGIAKKELIHIAQWAEHHFAGVRCGIMDQFSSMMGKKDHAILLDCRSLDYRYLPLALNAYKLLLCNTNVRHSLASSEYNIRRAECEEGLAIMQGTYPGLTSLRGVTPAMLQEHASLMPVNVYNRCSYVVEEIARVQEAALDLENGNLASFGTKMFQTHEGLSGLYQVSCPELDFLVDQARQNNVAGARMMGGGFGGCTLNLIASGAVDAFTKSARKAYREKFGIELTTYPVEVGNGVSVIQSENYAYNTVR